MMIRTLSALVLLGWLNAAYSQNDPCDNKLGRDFDEQTVEVRMARMNEYFDCRQDQDLRQLAGYRKHMLGGIQKWQSRAENVVRSTLRTKRTSYDAELRSIHVAGRDDLAADFNQQFAELDATLTTANRQEVLERRRELTAAHRSATSEQAAQQRAESVLLRDMLNQCSYSTASELKRLVIEDSKNVQLQFQQKSVRLRVEYTVLKQLPMGQTLNEYSATIPVDKGAIGVLTEGSGTVTRPSGEVIDAGIGTAVSPGDVVESGEATGCTIVFADESMFELDPNERLEIDEYIYDEESANEDGGFSFIRGVFVFTSGLIGKKEVRDVEIDAKGIGNLGFRG